MPILLEPPFPAEQGTPHRGPRPVIRLGVQSTRIQTLGLLRSELFTGNGSLAILSSQKPPARCQTLLPPSEFIWDRHGVLAVLGRRPAAGLWGQGSAHLAVAHDSGSRGKARLPRCPPVFPNPPLPPPRAGCPAGPLSTAWLAHLSSADSVPASEGAEFIFHNRSMREVGSSPIFHMWKLRLREVRSLAQSHTAAN